MGKRLGVIGFGTMGSEIALLGACAGMDVTAYDAFPEMFDTNLPRLGKVLRVLGRDPKFFAAEAIAEDAGREAVLGRLATTAELADLGGCEVVIEAAPENIELKYKLFGQLSELLAEDALVASNTSSISITEVAAAINNPARFVGMHFFNPPSAMKLVEVIPGLGTSEETIAATLALAKELGKKPIRVKETPGFVVNRVLLAMMNEAITLYEEGVASIEDIDEAMKLGAGMPLGPFKLADLVGLDTIHHASEVIYKELGRDKFRPPFALTQHVRAGRLGRKTRRGFYRY
ncbi:3-hydroxyacyl-CoA dehydrogenase family protein [bacterium]|nr:3-hydroxyacyl-CoA dehydrogenase family protein [bacterium]